MFNSLLSVLKSVLLNSFVVLNPFENLMKAMDLLPGKMYIMQLILQRCQVKIPLVDIFGIK